MFLKLLVCLTALLSVFDGALAARHRQNINDILAEAAVVTTTVIYSGTPASISQAVATSKATSTLASSLAPTSSAGHTIGSTEPSIPTVNGMSPPECAIKCSLALAADSPCAPTDTECKCSNPQQKGALTACVVQNCSIPDTLIAKRFTVEQCDLKVHNVGPLILAVSWVIYVLSFVTVVLRIVARTVAVKGAWGWDDSFVLFLLAVNTASVVLVTLGVHYGFGKDIWMSSPDHVTQSLMYMIIVQPFYNFVLGGLKVAIILFYLRVFDSTGGHKKFRILCWTMIVFVSLYSIAFVLVTIFTCNPISYGWKLWDGLHHGTCSIDRGAAALTHEGLNIASDLIIFIMPMPKLAKLNMSTKKKVLAMAMFGVGLFVTITSIVRVAVLIRDGTAASSNPTYEFAGFTIWAIVECGLGIFTACMPMASTALKKAGLPFMGSFRWLSSLRISISIGHRSSSAGGSGAGDSSAQHRDATNPLAPSREDVQSTGSPAVPMKCFDRERQEEKDPYRHLYGTQKRDSDEYDGVSQQDLTRNGSFMTDESRHSPVGWQGPDTGDNASSNDERGVWPLQTHGHV